MAMISQKRRVYENTTVVPNGSSHESSRVLAKLRESSLTASNSQTMHAKPMSLANEYSRVLVRIKFAKIREPLREPRTLQTFQASKSGLA